MTKVLTGAGFVHLHVHSSYSLLEGALTIATLSKLATADRQPALALTDTNNMFGALEFSEKLNSCGIQPIPGIQLSVMFEQPDPISRVQTRANFPIVLLAQNEEGYGNLMSLSSKAYFDVALGSPPMVEASVLQQLSGGLIALTGGHNGPLDSALGDHSSIELARTRLETLKNAYGDRLYVEVQRHGQKNEKQIERELISLADDHGLPIVATNEPFFAKMDDYEAHDTLLSIAEGRMISDDDRRRVSPQHSFKTRQQMVELFADLPEACAASVEIAMRCAYRVSTRKPILPSFKRDDEPAFDEENAVQRQAEEGLQRRLAQHGPAPGLTEQDYHDRLAYELSVITRMKYSGYFLIVADFIKWSKDHNIPVGPGRGSGAGSLVAYALTITDLDPLRFGLLFERFLNPERISMPDFDIDFCVEGRERVIEYVQHRYGETHVAQIITFGTLLARGVIRDVGRVLEMPYGQVDKLTKLIPQNPANPVTLKQAIDDEPKLKSAMEEEPLVARMLAIAQKLEGLHRHASTHAAGVVIGDRPLQELVALYRDAKTGMRVTQFNMKWVEQAGLVKFDFLGLKTLTVLKRAVELVAKRGIKVDLSTIPLDDPKTYEQLRKGETVGVFQVESVGMRKALTEMEADRFEDLIALVALYRPGPMANIPVYCARKLGKEENNKNNWYLHEKLKPILEETFGIIVYQEQVMQVAQILAGYSLGDADLLRRAMGKKIKAEMDAQRGRFVSGAVERGLSDAKANEIFDLLAEFANYGFNKSHAAAYALVSYQTAYMKANYPVEFLAASMTMDIDNTDKLAEFRREAHRFGIKVWPPSINQSGALFEVDNGEIYYALAAIKGVGVHAVEAIVEERGNKPFTNLHNLACRMNPKQVNKRILESMIAVGALDELEPDRAKANAAIESMLNLASQATRAASDGIQDMFGGVVASDVELRIGPYDPWPATVRLQKEYDAAGFFLSGHPLDEYGEMLRKLNVQTWNEFSRKVRSGADTGRVAATVLDKTERRTKTGNKMGIINFSDQSGHFEAVVFSEELMLYRDLLEPGAIVSLILKGSVEGDDVRARIREAVSLDEAVTRHQKGMRIFLRDDRPLDSIEQRLKSRGEGEVSLVLILENGAREVEIKLPGKYLAAPQIAGALRAVPGVVHVDIN